MHMPIGSLTSIGTVTGDGAFRAKFEFPVLFVTGPTAGRAVPRALRAMDSWRTSTLGELKFELA